MPARLPPKKQYPEGPPWRGNQDTVNRRTLNAAWNALLTRDLADISFRDLAKEVGVSTPALYHHYPSLHALGVDLVLSSGAALRNQMVDKATKHSSARACFKAYLRFAARRPHHFALLLSPRFREAKDVKASRARFIEDFTELLLADSGRKSVAPAEVHALWAALHGAGALVATGELTERAAFDAIKPLLDRLAGRNGRRSPA